MIKCLTTLHSTPGRKIAAGVEVLVGAIASGYLAHLLLVHWQMITNSYTAMAFISIPLALVAIGRWITVPLDRARVLYKKRKRH